MIQFLFFVTNNLITVIEKKKFHYFITFFIYVKMRGVKGHGYYTSTNFGPDNSKYKGFFVGIHTEEQHAGKLLKAQPVSEGQLKRLRQFHTID